MRDALTALDSEKNARAEYSNAPGLSPDFSASSVSLRPPRTGPPRPAPEPAARRSLHLRPSTNCGYIATEDVHDAGACCSRHQISRPAVLCVWFQSYIRRSSVSFPGTRATKEAGQILHPSAPMRKRMRFQDNSTNLLAACIWVLRGLIRNKNHGARLQPAGCPLPSSFLV